MQFKHKLKWGLFFLISLFFWAFWVWMMTYKSSNTWKEWGVFAIFTIMLLLGFSAFARAYIEVKTVEFTDENLIIIGFFGKKTPIPWNKIEGFGTWQTQYQNQIKVFTRDTEKEIAEMPTAFRRSMARIDYDFSGAIYFILEDMSGISMTELLEKCNQELKKHQKVKQIKHK